MKRIILLCCVLFLSACTLNTIEEEQSIAGSKYVFDNGMTILTKENPETGLVAVDALFKVSLAEEPVPGINNFVCQMLLAGTKKRTREEIAREIEEVGGEIDARIYTEYCEIKIIVPSESFSTGLNVLKDILVNSIFMPDDVEKQRTLILDQIKSKKDDPNIVEEELFLKTLYNDYPYANPLEGFEDDVKKITRDELVKHYKDWFSPNNLFLGIAGNFKEKQTIKALSKLFKNFEKQPLTSQPVPVPPIEGERTENKNMAIESFFVTKGYLLPSCVNPDFVKMRLVTSALGSGVSGRMFLELRNKQSLAYVAYAKQPSVRSKSFIKLIMIVRPDALNQSLAGMQVLVDQMKNEALADEELINLKNKIKGFFLLEHQKSIEQANYLAFYEMQGLGYKFDKDYINKIFEVSAQDMLDVSNKYFKNPALAVTGPFSKEDLIK